MALSRQFLEILVCPEDQSPLALADDPLLQRLNAAIRRGLVKNRSDVLIDTPVEAALVREDQQRLYLIVDDIPNLLADRAISLDQIPSPDSTTP